MATDKVIDVIIFDIEIGKLGYDIDQKKAVFQYNPDFLDSGRYVRLFPYFLNVSNLPKPLISLKEVLFVGFHL